MDSLMHYRHHVVENCFVTVLLMDNVPQVSSVDNKSSSAAYGCKTDFFCVCVHLGGIDGSRLGCAPMVKSHCFNIDVRYRLLIIPFLHHLLLLFSVFSGKLRDTERLGIEPSKL